MRRRAIFYGEEVFEQNPRDPFVDSEIKTEDRKAPLRLCTIERGLIVSPKKEENTRAEGQKQALLQELTAITVHSKAKIAVTPERRR